jgi:hypothetical protein
MQGKGGSNVRRLAVAAAVSTVALAGGGVAAAQLINGVPDANPREGSPLNILATGYDLSPVAHGTDRLENPIGIYTRYGFLNDSVQQADHEDTKTEPDQNTYVVSHHPLGGPTAGYNYGHHFLIQGHEVANSPNGEGRAYLTRINLDVKSASHRITLLNAPVAGNDTGMTTIDGSTYDPWTGQLLFTGEGGTHSGVFATDLNWDDTTPPPLTHLDGSMGTGGFEGIHNDKRGNLMIIEDAGGSGVTDNGTVTKVKQPNSFVFRFKPYDPSDLTKGTLQALQITAGGKPITFHDAAKDPVAARDDALGDQIKILHSGQTLKAKWITVHDTDADGTDAFSANALAKAAGATPLKRPENGKFVPGTNFRSFVFDETGDTDSDAGNYPGAAERGSWGALLRLDLPKAGADKGTVRTLAVGDATHASFDNVAFLDRKTVLIAEDRGDTLHKELNALDSLWAFNINKEYGQLISRGQRLMAEGRDPEALADVNLKEGGTGTHNDGDNEVTGIHVSNGSLSPRGLLGAINPARGYGFRMFVTAQHGENVTYEITKDDNGASADSDATALDDDPSAADDGSDTDTP